ncbi:MAG: UV DNA damage repair endonuclease UvsE [Candidatus Cohnella colombiensis]|uniref:UV DNA damage repair endonuclease UvsE n=1 Tax=Candidatus Cohnella colombiensis TaxID=3121368 RepID=A0AA95EUY4_9BACL|nr:MAG: UV DNA damage repair endonuclease UvsE [Cohnella sp.]
MIVRFGFVAMSTLLQNASPSRTMTMKSFSKLEDRDAGLRRLEQLAEENLNTTLRLLKHCFYMDVKVYRITSKLIPLLTHEAMSDWNPYPTLAPAFESIGSYAKEHRMRVSFHPDHFTVLSTPREEVFRNSVKDLDHHVRMLEAMGLDDRATCNIHVGGSYGDKETSAERFIRQYQTIEDRITNRITLENDDKTFTVLETLEISEAVGAPMVLDIHHHAVNPGNESEVALWPRILRTWERAGWNYRNGVEIGDAEWLPPKLHVSSPRSLTDPRSHADLVDPEPLLRFMYEIAGSTPAIDFMIEAKYKDGALTQLMSDLRDIEKSGAPIRVIDGGSVEVLG